MLAKSVFRRSASMSTETLRTTAQKLIALVEKLRTGDPTLKDAEVGPLILPREADRIAEWIDEAVTGGATLASGGKRLSGTTLQPAVLLDPTADAKISRQEIFGPVVAVYHYGDLDEAIALANSLPTAFQAIRKGYRRRDARG